MTQAVPEAVRFRPVANYFGLLNADHMGATALSRHYVDMQQERVQKSLLTAAMYALYYLHVAKGTRRGRALPTPLPTPSPAARTAGVHLADLGPFTWEPVPTPGSPTAC
ncbi:hypothetical protein OG866_37315 [Streptomyces sp. NBC_00663]|uniref:hypothetical protein n=1 Tax=Streptomyces sp. NBC_00663 TaxID=2975801 RepID=UPI002E354C06|nr:hypothetical protein [Streptomyces sp. NBC_00663]